jgi:hypothetical protein
MVSHLRLHRRREHSLKRRRFLEHVLVLALFVYWDLVKMRRAIRSILVHAARTLLRSWLIGIQHSPIWISVGAKREG